MVQKIMKNLGLNENIINLAMEGKVMCSDRRGIVEPHPIVLEKLEELKNFFGDEVTFYHIVDNHAMVCFLMYMSDMPNDGTVYAYVWNLVMEEWSDIGPVGLELMENGALKRSW